MIAFHTSITHGRVTSVKVVSAYESRDYTQDIPIAAGDELSVSFSSDGTPTVHVVRPWSRRWLEKRAARFARRLLGRLVGP